VLCCDPKGKASMFLLTSCIHLDRHMVALGDSTLEASAAHSSCTSQSAAEDKVGGNMRVSPDVAALGIEKWGTLG